ncbi:MAG: DEAD/DEAH box helicase [Oscillospiraceae bacterium]|nr:MAG: DEAD/DEAH box helicase [Oscillospiraceae bacterium]
MTVHVDSLSYGMSGRRLGGIFGFRTRHMVSYADNLRLLCEDVTRYREGGYRIAVIAENETAARSLADLFADAGIPAAIPAPGSADTPDAMPRGTVLIHWRSYLFGYELMVPRIAILSTNPDSRTGSLSTSPAVLRSRKRAADEARRRNTRTILSFNDLEPGDLVVHESYGIGRFTGIENLTAAGVSRDYIGIQYAGTDKLYIPVEKLDMVSKYIGAHADDGMIKLSKLGTDGWNRTKAKTKAVVREMAKDLISLYAERMRRPGHAFAPDDNFQQEFAAAFEYEETDGQLAAIDDIRQDMERSVPMDRLLCGDVGYGKTEVAMRAAFKCVAEGYQVAVLVPTTILALQHFQTFSRRMRAFAVNVDMISRFRTAKEQAVTLRRLERGDVDVIIGTHRLLGKDVQFRKLGLLIVDEEQRFGVAQKEKLKRLGGNIDVLTLSATPIPRTLNMAMGGIRDISILDDAPVDRLPVQTYVMEHDDQILHEAIRRELRRGGQVFYLHNAVENIRETAAHLQQALPDARITVAHGQMDKETLEEIWERMLTGEIDILVCTTIIETGGGHSQRQHADCGQRRPDGAVPAASAARARGAFLPARVCLLHLPSGQGADRHCRKAALGDPGVRGVRRGLPHCHARHGNPRQRQSARRRAARAHGIRRLRAVHQAAQSGCSGGARRGAEGGAGMHGQSECQCLPARKLRPVPCPAHGSVQAHCPDPPARGHGGHGGRADRPLR